MKKQNGNQKCNYMKKNLLYGFLFALVATGCYQEELSVTPQADCEGRYFTASFEEAQTRTYVEDGVLLRWTAGDQISLFDGNTLNRQYKFDGETGDNSGTFSIVNAPYGSGNDLTANYAVYPYASGVKISESGVVTAALPAEQTYAENSFGPGANTMVAVTKDKTDTFLRFKNICGYLKLQLYGENVTVKSITLTGKNNEKIAGAAAITPSYSGAPTVSIAEDATGSITLNCDEGVKIGTSAETATAFWIAVPPTTFDEGFEVTITGAYGGSFTKSTSKKISIERNVIKPMTAFEVEIETIPNNQIWYTSSDGKVLVPYKTDGFGVDIVSNTYENGKGIITFAGDLTTIGDDAFASCYYLTSIVIPNSVTTIETYAFADCHSLTSVTIPDSVTEIENGVFAGCFNLKEFKGKFASDGGRCLIKDNAIIAYANASGTEYTIPDNVTTIWNGTFLLCDLTEITVPDNVKTIQPAAFFCPNLKTINGKYATADGRFYIIDGAIKIFAPSGLTECVIPDGVTNVEYRTFVAARFASLTIPESVTEISYHALYNCYNLTSIYCKAAIPPTAVFNHNTWGAFPGDAAIYVPVESVLDYRKAAGWKDYAECIVAYDFDKEEAVISDNIIYYTSYDGKIVEPYDTDAFGAKIISNTYENGQGVIEFDSDVISIGYQTFRDCSKLTSITIPASVIEVEPLAFYNCYRLEQFKGCYASNYGSCLIVDGMLAAYAEASGVGYSIPDNVTVVGPHVFDNFYDLTHIDIPDGVKTISYGAFQSCSSLTSITIPDSVTEIEDQAFIWCFGLKDVTLGDGVETIGGFAFRDCPIVSLTIPGSVKTIGRGAFQYCSSLSDLTIGNGVNEILYEAFDGCYNLAKVTIPASVTKIGNNAFSNCGNLISICCEATTPPIATYWVGENYWEAFDNNASGRKIYVPRNSINAYKSAEGWSNYASDIEGYNF